MLGAKTKDSAGGGGDLRYLFRSILFLFLLGVLGYFTRERLIEGFVTNALLNGTILAVLAFGILYTLMALVDVLRVSRAAHHATMLVREVQAGNKQLAHVNEILLGPSHSGVGDFLRTVHRILSQGEGSATLPYMLDSVAAHGEDRRALVRYLTGALVLLGLIGTFYGLLITIGGVRDVLGNLSASEEVDTVALLINLKERLSEPLDGMGIAFSSSLLGLLSSLILAFLELQLFHGQNNLHARLETLVVSDLMPLWHQPAATARGGAEPASPAYVTALLSNTAERMDVVVAALERLLQHDQSTTRVSEQLAGLGERIESLRETLDTLEKDRTAALSNELRVLTRTLSREP
jgi:hypothetical protein